MKTNIQALSRKVSMLSRTNRQLKKTVNSFLKADQSRHYGNSYQTYSREDQFQPSSSEDYLQLYESYIHVFSCVDVIAQNLAKLAFRIYKLKSLSGDKDRRGDEVTDGPVWNLFNQPNKFMSGYNLFYGMIAYFKLTGIAFLEKVGRPKNLVELWLLRSDWMKIKADPVNLIGGYEYTVDGQVIKYTPEEILRVKSWHPRSELYGLGITNPAQSAIITDLYANKYSKQFFKQGGHINWYLSVKEELGDVEYKRLEQQLKTKTAGLEVAHTPIVLDNEATIKELGGSPDRAVLLPQKTLSRDEVCEAFRVPALMLGLPNDTHYNNADAQYLYFWEQTIQPLGRELEDTINRDILWPIGMEGAFDYSPVKVLRPQVINLLQAGKTAVDGKILTPNEVRGRMLKEAYPDLEPLPGGDEFPETASPFSGFGGQVAKHSDLGLMVKIMELMKGGENSGHHGHYPAPEGRGSAKAITKEVTDDIERDIIYGRFPEAFDKLRSYGLTVAETTALITSAKKRSPLHEHLDSHGIRTKKINLELKKAIVTHRDKVFNIAAKDILKVVGDGYRSYGEAVLAVVGTNLKKIAFEKKDMVSEAVASLDPVTKEMAKKLLKVEKGLLNKIITAEYKRAKASEPNQAEADRLESKVGERLEKIVGKSVGYIESTAKDRVQTHLTDLMNSDASVETITKDITDLLMGDGEEYTGQARTIARTETLKFTETSRFGTLTEMGFTEKEWFHSGHDKPREDHLAADGEVVPMNEKFSTGLQYPGDPDGAPEDVCNCGCTWSEFISEAVEEN